VAAVMQVKEKKLGQGVFNEKLEGSSLRGGVLRKIATGLSVAGRLKKRCIRVRLEMAHGMAVNSQRPRGEGARVKNFTVRL